tara:strand:- start:1383 stop:2627 length:1245 start_codon:yes stop_codon:yes gene_type:complete
MSDADDAAQALIDASAGLRRRASQYATTFEAYAAAAAAQASGGGGGGGLLPLFPPPLVDMDATRKALPASCSAPFLCTSAGALPRGVPDDVDDLVAGYLVSGVSDSPPNIDVDFESVECASNGQARRALTSASAEGKRYWAACHVPIEHPRWWPSGRGAEAVPGFEHLIVGEGSSGIGMHRDRYREDGRPDRLVSTYLSLGRGRKHVVLLPPTDEGAAVAELLGGLGCDNAYGRSSSQRVAMPVRPPPELLERVLQCGGFWFDLEAGSAGPSDAEGGRCSDDLAKGEASEAGEAGEGEAGGEEEARQTTQDEDADAEEEDDDDDDDDDEALCLFMPAGWWHWLLADSKWHVAWSGSFFPDCGQGGGRGSRGGRGQGRGGRVGGGGSARREAGAPGAKGKEQQKGSRAPRWARAL